MASKRSGPSIGHTVLRKKFGRKMTFRSCQDNEVVFSQGDVADSVFYIDSGTVKLTAVSAPKKAIIAVLWSGSFFGEGCLAGQSVRVCTARSIGQSNIIRLQKNSMVRTLKKDPHFASLFVRYLLSRVARIEEDLIDQFFNFSERRLARVLLLFGQITKESKSDSPLKVSQSTLAEMVGTTRARISAFMNSFRRRGLVSYNGGLKIDASLLMTFLQARPMSVKKGEMKTKGLDQIEQISVECPTCGAAAGKRCLLSAGGLRNEPHASRKASAIEAIDRKRGMRV